MFRQFRPIEKGEFILAGGDCSQGGKDHNYCQFFSKTKLDFPLVYQKRGVAAEMTTAIFPVLEKIYDTTGIKPVVGLERNNGGASEMQRLSVLNRLNKYILFVMPKIGNQLENNLVQESEKLGWDTNVSTRPTLLGDFKAIFDNRGFSVYDEETLTQAKSFIVNSHGKPEAARNKRDDAIFAAAVAWQMSIRSSQQVIVTYYHEPENSLTRRDWSFK